MLKKLIDAVLLVALAFTLAYMFVYGWSLWFMRLWQSLWDICWWFCWTWTNQKPSNPKSPRINSRAFFMPRVYLPMRKTFYCSLGVLKSVLGVCCQLVNLTANHALLQLQTLPQLQLWLMLQGTKSLLQFFGSNFFAEYAANKFFNFVPTKSGRQANLLRFFTNLIFLVDRAICSVIWHSQV